MPDNFCNLMYPVDLDKAIYKTQLPNLFVTKDKRAHKLTLSLSRKGSPIVYSGTVSATLITYANNLTKTATGTVENGCPTVVFPAEFYAHGGMFCLLVSIGDKNTVFAGEGYMITGETDTVYDPSGVVPSLSELLAQLDAARAATTAANTAAGRANTAASEGNTAAATAAAAAETAIAAAARAEAAARGWETDTAGNSAMLGGKDPGFFAADENLLDNCYFWQAPYNQRGQSEYSGAVTGFDRWRGMSRTSVWWGETDDDLLPLTGLFVDNTSPTAGNCYLQQIIPAERLDVVGTTRFTVAVCTANGVHVATGERGTSVQVTVGNTAFSFIRTSDGKDAYRITLAKDEERSIPICWLGLFAGTVTAENVPFLRSRTQGEEAARCKWFFRRHGAAQTYGTLADGMARTATTAWITIPRTEMRGTPTVTLTGQLYVQHGNGTSIAVTSYNVEKISDDYIRLLLTVSGGLTPGMPLIALAGSSAEVYIDEDCDLV